MASGMQRHFARAVYAGNVARVTRFLSASTPIDFSDPIAEWGGECDLVDVAAIEGHLDVLRELLKYGARNRTFIRHAIHHDLPQIISEWLKLGEPVSNYTDGDMPLVVLAAGGGSMECLELLVNAGASLDAICTRTGQTVLTRAIDDIDSSIGITRLSYLWPRCSSEIQCDAVVYAGAVSTFALRFLIESMGANLYSEAEDGRSAMDCAIEHSSLDRVKFLVEKGWDMWRKSKRFSLIPVDLAAKLKAADIANYLQTVFTDSL